MMETADGMFQSFSGLFCIGVMWVRVKKKIQLSEAEPKIAITQSVQKGSKWLAFYEDKINENLPWRLNHRHLNI